MKSYLSGRTQCVKIRNSYSSYKDVTIGVPRGSILGPILFIIYVNDLPNLNADMTCLSYADDTAIIIKGDNVSDLQFTVNTLMVQLSDWFHANSLSINVSKTYTQHYATRTSEFQLDVKINGKHIEEKDSIRYRSPGKLL